MADWQHFVTHAYTGDRFHEAALDVQLLPDLKAFHDLILEVATHLWWQANPGRKQVDRNFAQHHSLRCTGFRHGSTAADLQRRVAPVPYQLDLDGNLLDRARLLVEGAIVAANSSTALPAAFPRKALARFRRWGRRLQGEEAIELRDEHDLPRSRYGSETRGYLLSLLHPAYEDQALILGNVLAANVSRRTFEIFPVNDGANGVAVPLSTEHERVVLDALTRYDTVQLQVRGRASFSKDGKAQKFISVEALETHMEERVVDNTGLWSMMDALSASVPDEVWDRVPRDASANLDAYL